MARLEDILPEIRKGRRVRLENRTYLIRDGELFYEEEGFPYPIRVGFAADLIFSVDWEIVPEPVKVADYLQPDPFSMSVSGKCSRWVSKTYPVGQQPEGSMMVPGSEREEVERKEADLTDLQHAALYERWKREHT